MIRPRLESLAKKEKPPASIIKELKKNQFYSYTIYKKTGKR